MWERSHTKEKETASCRRLPSGKHNPLPGKPSFELGGRRLLSLRVLWWAGRSGSRSGPSCRWRRQGRLLGSCIGLRRFGCVAVQQTHVRAVPAFLGSRLARKRRIGTEDITAGVRLCPGSNFSLRPVRREHGNQPFHTGHWEPTQSGKRPVASRRRVQPSALVTRSSEPSSFTRGTMTIFSTGRSGLSKRRNSSCAAFEPRVSTSRSRWL